MSKAAIKKSIALLAYGVLSMYTGARLVIDLLTLPDDVRAISARLPMWVQWLFSTPWWVPAALLVAISVGIIALMVNDNKVDGGEF